LLQQQNAQNAIPRLGRRSPAPSVDLPSFTSGFLPNLPAYLSQRNPKRAAAPYDLAAYLQRQPSPLR
jgi:hypothetical protein